jgi:pyruvate dehydrogenase E1 component alpha subunit
MLPKKKLPKKLKDLVQECVTFAEESDYPQQQLYDVVYDQENYPFIPHKL